MSTESVHTAGILLVVFPTVVFGGAGLLWHWITRNTSYYDKPLRRSLWRAGHAHAGVLLILTLVALQGVPSRPSGAGEHAPTVDREARRLPAAARRC
jgi:hypothetical protein